MKVLVTGANGRLGTELLALDWTSHDVQGLRRVDGDLSDRDAALALLQDRRPDVVVHTAASTDLVRCEKDRQFAWENVAMPAIHVAQACVDVQARMVHISTDYVFSGDEPQHPIPTWMRPDPTHYYAVCKVAAEVATQVVPNHLVVRTTMKPRGPWRHDKAPRDMWISHSHYDEVAPFVRDVAVSGRKGIVHFGKRDVNVYELAKESRPDVQGVDRSEIGTLRLPGDIRLEVTDGS